MRRLTSKPAWWLPLAALCVAQAAMAQIKWGDNFNLSSANGEIGAGYTASYGDLQQSSHSLSWNGTGTVTGYYHNPAFLSFSAQPYYDQSRANSESQSINSSSGLNLSSSIFSGSNFPGSITYTKAYNSDGTFGEPGLPDFTTHGNSDALGIGWSELLPGWPSLSAQFVLGHSAYSIYGTNDEGTARSMSLSLHSSYQTHGFNLNGGYSRSQGDSEVPLLLTNEGLAQSDSTSSSLTFGASHSLPMRGNFTTSLSRYSSDYSFSTNQMSGNSANDNFIATASILPVDKVSVSGSMSYDDNLGGSIIQQIQQAGGLVNGLYFIPGSHSLSMAGSLGYTPRNDLSFTGQIQRREQNWSGMNLGMTSYTGFGRYSHSLWGGDFGTSASMTASQTDNEPGMTMGFSAALNYSRQLGAWNLSAGGGYAQNVQTVLITYMSSNYSFGGSARRRIKSLYWSGNATVARTGLTVQQGSAASSESFSMSLSTGRRFAGSASYQNSSGTALQTVTGPAPTPIPLPFNPLFILYSGRSYSFSFSSSPIRRLAIAASYARSLSDTMGGTANSNNDLRQFSVNTHYQWRKMYLTAGYAKFEQGISIAGIPPSRVSTFYVGVYRWFNFF